MKKLFHYLVYCFAIIGFVLTSGYFAVKLGITNEKGVIDTQRDTFITKGTSSTTHTTTTPTVVPAFTTTEEWKILKDAVHNDREAIYKASAMMHIQPRMIVAILIVEQLRLYHDNREVFKTFFAPLKVLGVQSQFSWGVMGVKQETAIETEEHLKATSSPFYLGTDYEHVLDFSTDDHDKERFDRIVNEHDRYYSYLYAAVIIKQLMTQWHTAGFDITKRPEVISTLFNIGFRHSQPHANPKSGGAPIPLGTTTYSFGSLAKEFYYSNELLESFPR